MPGPATSALVDCGVYLDGQRLTGDFTPAAARAKVRELGDGFVWVGLHEPDERQMQDVAEVFGLHPLVVEDAVHAHQRPKLERYDDTLFLVLKTVQYVPHESVKQASEIVETGEIMIFVAADFVVTVRHGDFSGADRQLSDHAGGGQRSIIAMCSSVWWRLSISSRWRGCTKSSPPADPTKGIGPLNNSSMRTAECSRLRRVSCGSGTLRP